MFYEFHQNNSYGVFDYNAVTGISQSVIVEADSVEEANMIAERIGLYFDGCDDGTDCSCCGDRWTAQWSDSSGDPVPSNYGVPLDDPDRKNQLSWMGVNPSIFVHYKNGRVEAINS
jgi:hypothetical protein